MPPESLLQGDVDEPANLARLRSLTRYLLIINIIGFLLAGAVLAGSYFERPAIPIDFDRPKLFLPEPFLSTNQTVLSYAKEHPAG